MVFSASDNFVISEKRPASLPCEARYPRAQLS
jgi:hypothetical protein